MARKPKAASNVVDIKIVRGRGRPKGSHKAPTNGPSEDDLLLAVREMTALNAERKALGAKISKARKQMKAKNIEFGVLDSTMAMLEWSPGEVRQHLERQSYYARTFNLPVLDLVDMFEEHQGTGGDPEIEHRKWWNTGRKDGLAGRGWPQDAPEGCPPECRKDYADGHDDGQKDVLAALERDMQKPFVPPKGELAPADADEPDEPTEDEVDF
jgi:hypothetical protein